MNDHSLWTLRSLAMLRTRPAVIWRLLCMRDSHPKPRFTPFSSIALSRSKAAKGAEQTG